MLGRGDSPASARRGAHLRRGSGEGVADCRMTGRGRGYPVSLEVGCADL